MLKYVIKNIPDGEKNMLTYNFENIDCPIYEYIYKCIKNDILSGNILPGTRLPSKRSFANNHGISTITIQNAYDQLISEGYVYTLPKKGYYVSELQEMTNRMVLSGRITYDIVIPEKEICEIDISGNSISSDTFPFSTASNKRLSVSTG